MDNKGPSNLGDISTRNNYNGKHRIFEMPRGTALIGLGDRNRCKPEYGVDVVEDRDSDPNIRRI